MENQLDEFESENDSASDSSEDLSESPSQSKNRCMPNTRGEDPKKHRHASTGQGSVPREGREKSREEEEDREKEKDRKKKDKERRKKSELLPPSEVTGSGFPNVLDGIHTPVGQLLIMTTNHVETLDEALIRPGRADKKIYFTHATQKQAEMLFCNMYQPSPAMKPPPFDEKRIPKLAKQFAKRIPERLISCAHLQSYVIQYMLDPQAAVDGLTAWIQEYLRENQQLELGEAYVPEEKTTPASQDDKASASQEEGNLIEVESEDLLLPDSDMEYSIDCADLLGLDESLFLADSPKRTPATFSSPKSRKSAEEIRDLGAQPLSPSQTTDSSSKSWYTAPSQLDVLGAVLTTPDSLSSVLHPALIPTPSRSSPSPNQSPTSHTPSSASLTSAAPSSKSNKQFTTAVKRRVDEAAAKFVKAHYERFDQLLEA